MTLFQKQKDLADIWLGESARTSCKSIEAGEHDDDNNNNNEVRVCFRNLTDIPLVLCWVDIDGTPDNFYRLDSCTSSSSTSAVSEDISDDDHVENSFVGHAFIIARGTDVEEIIRSKVLDAAATIVGGYRSKKGGQQLVEIYRSSREETTGPDGREFDLVVKGEVDPTTVDLADTWLGESARTSCVSIDHAGDEELRVCFRNLCDIPLVLCWVDVDGTPDNFYRLDPCETDGDDESCADHVENSFVGHAFIIARGDDIDEILHSNSLDGATIVGGYRSRKGGLQLVEINSDRGIAQQQGARREFYLTVTCLLLNEATQDLADIWLGESARTSCVSIDHAGGEELRVCFRNFSDIPLVLCWVDVDGTPDNFYRLDPCEIDGDVSYEDHVENSFVGHAFIIARGDDIEEILHSQSLDGATIVGGYRSKKGGLHLVEIHPSQETATACDFDIEVKSGEA